MRYGFTSTLLFLGCLLLSPSSRAQQPGGPVLRSWQTILRLMQRADADSLRLLTTTQGFAQLRLRPDSLRSDMPAFYRSFRSEPVRLRHQSPGFALLEVGENNWERALYPAGLRFTRRADGRWLLSGVNYSK